MTLLFIGVEAICVGIGLFYMDRFRQTALRLLVGCLCMTLCIDIVLELVPDPTGIWARRQYDLMLPAEFAVYVTLFRPTPKWLFWALTGGFFAFGTYQFVFRAHVDGSATYVFRLLCLLMLPLLLLYFRNLLLSQEVLSLSRNPLFWISTSLLLFYAGNAIVTGFYFLLTQRFGKAAQSLFYINYVLGLVRYAAFTVAFVMAGRNADGR